MSITDSIINYRRFLKRRSLSAHTVKNYIHMLRQFVLWVDVPVEKVDHKKMLEYVDSLLDRHLAPKTINCHLNGIRGFYRYLYYEEDINVSNPVENVDALKQPQPLPRYLRDDEIRTFFRTVNNFRDRAMFKLMLRCGLRVEEVANLTLDAIELERRKILGVDLR